jgi:hypothetical protein
MAIEKTLILQDNFKVEVLFESAYIKIEKVSVSVNTMEATLQYKKSATGDILQKEIVACSYDINGINPIKQAYEYLKTLPEFKDAVDC